MAAVTTTGFSSSLTGESSSTSVVIASESSEHIAIDPPTTTTPSNRPGREGMVLPANLSSPGYLQAAAIVEATTAQRADEFTRATVNSQTKVSVMQLDNLGITAFPLSFNQYLAKGVFSSLSVLNCNNNKLGSLSGLKTLRCLEELNAENNRITSLSGDIGELTALCRVHLGGNLLGSLPPEISQLTNLTRLFMENNQIAFLPPEIGKLHSLKWLSLDGNQLTTLPPEIGKLSKLGWFSVENNRLEYIPSEMGQLSSLEALSLLDNPSLYHLPKSLSQLNRLTDLRVNTPLRLEKDVLMDNAKGIVNYLDSIIRNYNLPFDYKGHWEPDEKANQCTRCNTLFTFTTRRHHCRLCGRIFCKKCCSLNVEIVVMGSVRVCDVCIGLIGSTVPALSMQDEMMVEIEYGLTDEEEDSLSVDEKKKKLSEQLRELNVMIDAAIRKKEGFQKLLTAYGTDTSTSDTQMLLREKAKQEFTQQERLVVALVESQIKLLKMIEDVFSEAPPKNNNDPLTND